MTASTAQVRRLGRGGHLALALQGPDLPVQRDVQQPQLRARNGDGQAWDADYGDGTLYQYNYSYGNSFASLMICNQYAINTTFRYNISQNDRRGVFDLPSNGPGNHIYNNTVYIGKDSAVLTGRSNSQAKFENNIFITRPTPRRPRRGTAATSTAARRTTRTCTSITRTSPPPIPTLSRSPM